MDRPSIIALQTFATAFISAIVATVSVYFSQKALLERQLAMAQSASM